MYSRDEPSTIKDTTWTTNLALIVESKGTPKLWLGATPVSIPLFYALSSLDFLPLLPVTSVTSSLANMASSSSSTSPFVVHTTPPFARLPASDVESIYIAAVFQLAAPGRFALQTADWGDNAGSLPFVTHLGQRVRKHDLTSIHAYADPDEDLDAGQKAEVLSWTGYIEQNLTDLVVCPSFISPFKVVHYGRSCGSL